MAIMSMRQYAKHRGVALSAVQKAVKAGRIAKLPDGHIDSEAADAGWKQNTRTYAPAVTRRAKPERGPEPEEVRRTEPEEESQSSSGASQYTKARAVREHYQARLTKLDYEERSGDLVRKAEVQVAAFNHYRRYRDHMLNIPDRVAAMVAAEADAAKCHEIIASEIRRILNDFADANG
jgi:hypothetical protein